MSTRGRSTAQPARRAQVASACESCRLSKVKCSGRHPVCARCETRGTECKYDVLEEGMTKREYLRQELSGQRQELERTTAILRVLQLGTDQEATELLARLRMGVSIDEAYDQMFEGRQSRESYDISPGEPIDPALMATDGAQSFSSMMGVDGVDGAAAGSSSHSYADDSKQMDHDGSQQVDGEQQWQMPSMEEPEWGESTLQSSTSTVSMADVHPYSDPNIDPALQRRHHSGTTDGSAQYDHHWPRYNTQDEKYQK